MPPEPFFSGPGLDRADALRADDAALRDLARAPDAAQLVWRDGLPELTPEGRLAWGPASESDLFLGLDGRSPRFSGIEPVAPDAWSATALPDLVDEVDGLWVLRYGEIRTAEPALAELVLRRTQHPAGPEQLYVAVGIGDSDDRPTAVSGHHLALDGLRRVVWMAAAGGASLEDLHVAANRELADKHPISVQLVAAAVRDLMALRLLVPEHGVGRAPAPAELVH